MSEENSFTSVGTFLTLSATLPTDSTAAAFATAFASPIEVGGVDTIGEIRMTRNINSRTPLKTGVEVNSAGGAVVEPIAVDGAIIRGDEGQEMLESHLRSAAKLAFCVNYPDGGKEYGVAIVTAGGRSPGEDANAFAGMSYELKPSGATVIVDPT